VRKRKKKKIPTTDQLSTIEPLMEISGAVFQRSSIGAVHHRLLFGRRFDGGAPRSAPARVRVPATASCGGAVFCDEGALQYYEEGRSKQDKKRAKLIKTLKKDLSELYSMGFGVPADQSDKIVVCCVFLPVFLYLFCY
jgi:hypothetical protein